MLFSNITDERLAIFQWGVIISASLVSAIWDVRLRRIPNIITFPLLLAGLLWVTCHGGLSSLAEGVGACILLALPYVFLFFFANGGAGDAKLMGAIGAWLGFKQGIVVLCCVATAGIILAIIKSLIKRQARALSVTCVSTAHQRGKSLPVWQRA